MQKTQFWFSLKLAYVTYVVILFDAKQILLMVFLCIHLLHNDFHVNIRLSLNSIAFGFEETVNDKSFVK